MIHRGRFLGFYAACALFGAAPAQAEMVRHIVVEGAQRIEASAVESYAGLSVGQDLDEAALDQGLKKIYDTGFYADVAMNISGDTLTITVSENPTINEVIFEGNDQINKDDLEKEITLKARSIYSRIKVQSDLKRLLDVYRRAGRFAAEITPQIITKEQNRVNLVYNIVEGPKALIEHISFIGNDHYESSVLKSVISSSQEVWYQFLTDSDRYDPDRLNYDQELLRRFYFANGYVDFKVKSAIAELSPQKDAFYLTFTIEEGEPYHIGTLKVNSKLPKEKLPDLESLIISKPGQLYNATEIEDTVNRMTDKLGDSGFAFVEIDPKLQRVEGKDKIVNITFDVGEGPKVYVERINIFGNLSTKDHVIRREFKIAEGDAFSASKLKRSEQRLNNLGYFEKVDIKRKPGSAPDKTQIDVDVTEKSTGEITFGAGFSTVDGPLVDLGIKERNFLGNGQELRARATIGGLRRNIDLGFTEPYFLGRQVDAGFDIYRTDQNFQDNSTFDRSSLGATLRFGYALSENWRHQLRYSFEESEITNVSADASRYIRDQQGTFTASTIGHSFIYDGRDNKQAPTSGGYARLSEDIAGLGGTGRFLRHEANAEYYVPIAKKWTYAVSGSAGTIIGLGKDVPINERFFIGQQEIRGFANAGIGPRDTGTQDSLGGNTYYAVSNEVRFPLGLSDDLGVTGAVFIDAGSEYGLDNAGGPGVADDSSLRAAAGFGILWASSFGPIRIDFAVPLLKENYDDAQLVRFGFGTRF